MIYLKLAGRNFKRSLRDYAIYFFTLAVSVMIFYTFNALTDMPVIQELAQKGDFSPESLKFMLISISVFVAFVVFVLVIFSNNFIIRRRNREIGTYLLLGMNQRKVARMLFLETIALGVLACLLGLGLGVAFSGIFSLIFALILGNVTPTILALGQRDKNHGNFLCAYLSGCGHVWVSLRVALHTLQTLAQPAAERGL